MPTWGLKMQIAFLFQQFWKKNNSTHFTINAPIYVASKITYMAYEFGKFEWILRNVEGLIALPRIRKAVQSLTLEHLRSLDGPRQILY